MPGHARNGIEPPAGFACAVPLDGARVENAVLVFEGLELDAEGDAAKALEAWNAIIHSV